MDVQMSGQNEELLQSAPEIQDFPLPDDEEEYWRAFDDIHSFQEDEQRLPAGCPETTLHQKSYELLQETQQAARVDSETKYSSTVARLRMQIGLGRAASGMKPRFYQEDCAEAFLLGLNTGLICPTGSGKTEAFILPLFADPEQKSRIIIISPLKALQDDHAKRFARYGISAAAVNGETYSDELHKRMAQGEIRAIITSPEMMFKHDKFSKLFRDADWTKTVIGVVVDEAHCVLDWGKDFRRDFDNIDQSRAFMSTKPLFFCTATLTPSMLDELLQKLSYPKQRSFILNLGCERHNVTPVVCRLKGPNDYEALDFLLDEAFADPPKPLIPTLIYAEQRGTVINIWSHLKNKLPEDSPYRSEVDFLIATRDDTAKNTILGRFMYGEVKILCSTEAAGMGLDAKTRRVVQFGIPRTLLQWQQHAGRAGRDGEPAYALLLVEPSVFQVVTRKQPKKPNKGKGKAKVQESDSMRKDDDMMDVTEDTNSQVNNVTRTSDITIKQEASDIILSQQIRRGRALRDQEFDQDEDQAPMIDPSTSDELQDQAAPVDLNVEVQEYRKRVDEDMRLLCTTEKCRRQITMRAFNSPPPLRELTVSCCDNCLLDQGDTLENPLTLSEQDDILLKLIYRLDERLSKKQADSELDPSIDLTGKPTVSKKRGKLLTRKIKDALEDLRSDFWKNNYGFCMFTKTTIMPDSVLSTIASDPRIKTVAHLNEFLPAWDFADEMGAIVLAAVIRIDDEWHSEKDKEKRQRADIKKAKTAREKVIKDERERQGRLQATEKKRVGQLREAAKTWYAYVPPSEPTNSSTTQQPPQSFVPYTSFSSPHSASFETPSTPASSSKPLEPSFSPSQPFAFPTGFPVSPNIPSTPAQTTTTAQHSHTTVQPPFDSISLTASCYRTPSSPYTPIATSSSSQTIAQYPYPFASSGPQTATPDHRSKAPYASAYPTPPFTPSFPSSTFTFEPTPFPPSEQSTHK